MNGNAEQTDDGESPPSAEPERGYMANGKSNDDGAPTSGGPFPPGAGLLLPPDVLAAFDVGNPADDTAHPWATVPDVNLYNQKGLPACPFRTYTD